MDLPEVLIVDDDAGIRSALRRGLELAEFRVRDVATGEAALAAIGDRPPAIVVLDVAMPGIDGVEVVRRIRGDGLTLPVCMLSARDEVDDRVAGLAAGADDYVVKPFSVGELAARLHALVRLHRQRPEQPIVVGELVVDPGRRIVSRSGRDLGLTTREFDLVHVLAEHAGQVLTRAHGAASHLRFLDAPAGREATPTPPPRRSDGDAPARHDPRRRPGQRAGRATEAQDAGGHRRPLRHDDRPATPPSEDAVTAASVGIGITPTCTLIADTPYAPAAPP